MNDPRAVGVLGGRGSLEQFWVASMDTNHPTIVPLMETCKLLPGVQTLCRADVEGHSNKSDLVHRPALSTMVVNSHIWLFLF